MHNAATFFLIWKEKKEQIRHTLFTLACIVRTRNSRILYQWALNSQVPRSRDVPKCTLIIKGKQTRKIYTCKGYLGERKVHFLTGKFCIATRRLPVTQLQKYIHENFAENSVAKTYTVISYFSSI